VIERNILDLDHAMLHNVEFLMVEYVDVPYELNH
jgi:hypothetical protein